MPRPPSASAIPTTIRVGVVEYDNFAKSVQDYRDYFREVEKAALPQQLNGTIRGSSPVGEGPAA